MIDNKSRGDTLLGFFNFQEKDVDGMHYSAEKYCGINGIYVVLCNRSKALH